ncbi:MAG: nucleotide exchange factor GrpE [Lachnospiraceae bacterium]|nr:nucleotide exchange factor GrpE [Lachnospiraceae bacterium]
MIVEEKELDNQNSEDINSAKVSSEEAGSEAENAPEEAEAGEDNAADDDKKEKKKSVFAKDKKSNKLQEKVDELEDRVKRQMAEFDNFRKRSEKEKSAMFETGAKSVIEKILPVVDNFERGLAGLSEEDMSTPFAEGMSMVYKQLIAELEKLEVKPIEAVGCEFDPELHNAVMQVASEEYESGIVAQELQKGYTYRDSVVRHSMVAVVE